MRPSEVVSTRYVQVKKSSGTSVSFGVTVNFEAKTVNVNLGWWEIAAGKLRDNVVFGKFR